MYRYSVRQYGTYGFKWSQSLLNIHIINQHKFFVQRGITWPYSLKFWNFDNFASEGQGQIWDLSPGRVQRPAKGFVWVGPIDVVFTCQSNFCEVPQEINVQHPLMMRGWNSSSRLSKGQGLMLGEGGGSKSGGNTSIWIEISFALYNAPHKS